MRKLIKRLATSELDMLLCPGSQYYQKSCSVRLLLHLHSKSVVCFQSLIDPSLLPYSAKRSHCSYLLSTIIKKCGHLFYFGILWTMHSNVLTSNCYTLLPCCGNCDVQTRQRHREPQGHTRCVVQSNGSRRKRTKR